MLEGNPSGPMRTTIPADAGPAQIGDLETGTRKDATGRGSDAL